MNENNWIKWSSIAEIISSISVLVTLIYLAVQTSQISKQTEINTAALLSNSRQSALNTELQLLLSNQDHRDSWIGPRLTSNPEYSDDTLLGILIDQVAFFRIRENSWLQYQAGVLDAKIWEGYLKVLITSLKTTPVARESWELTSVNFESSFVEEVEKHLR